MAKIQSDITVIEKLYENIKRIIEQARKKVYRTVNFAMVEAYWNIGRLIVENEQKGKRRAEYGTALIKKLSEKLSREFGKGYDTSNLKRMRQFYLTFLPIQNSSPENGKGAAPRHLTNHANPMQQKSAAAQHQLPSPMLREELSWTHYKSLIRVENAKARQWYLNEAADCNWGTRALDRQINTFYYERLLAGCPRMQNLSFTPKAFKPVRRTPHVCNLGFVICNFPDKLDTFWFRLVRAKDIRGIRDYSHPFYLCQGRRQRRGSRARIVSTNSRTA